MIIKLFHNTFEYNSSKILSASVNNIQHLSLPLCLILQWALTLLIFII